jgi:hypothetical protein
MARFEPTALYEMFYCARGDIENRIIEKLFTDNYS